MLKESSCVVVLSHKQLGREFFSRLKKAILIYKKKKIKYFVLLSEAANTKKVIDYVINKTNISPENLLFEINSKDTIGEAFLLKKNIIERLKVNEIHVVTSDYHLNYRVKIIFDFFYNKKVFNVLYHSVKTEKLLDRKVFLDQIKSLDNFLNLIKNFKEEDILINHNLYKENNERFSDWRTL